MGQKSQTRQTVSAKAIKDIRRVTRKQYSAEEKIRIVLDGLRGEETICNKCSFPFPLKRGHYFIPDRGEFDGSGTTVRRGHSKAVGCSLFFIYRIFACVILKIFYSWS